MIVIFVLILFFFFFFHFFFLMCFCFFFFFFFASRRRHTRCLSDWSSDVCSSDLGPCRSRAGTEPGRCHLRLRCRVLGGSARVSRARRAGDLRRALRGDADLAGAEDRASRTSGGDRKRVVKGKRREL